MYKPKYPEVWLQQMPRVRDGTESRKGVAFTHWAQAAPKITSVTVEPSLGELCVPLGTLRFQTGWQQGRAMCVVSCMVRLWAIRWALVGPAALWAMPRETQPPPSSPELRRSTCFCMKGYDSQWDTQGHRTLPPEFGDTQTEHQ